jgi:hypothetical protein
VPGSILLTDKKLGKNDIVGLCVYNTSPVRLQYSPAVTDDTALPSLMFITTHIGKPYGAGFVVQVKGYGGGRSGVYRGGPGLKVKIVKGGIGIDAVE